MALPAGYPKNDWLAEHGKHFEISTKFPFDWYPYSFFPPKNELNINIVETYLEQITGIWGNVSSFCTPETCPEMTAGPK